MKIRSKKIWNFARKFGFEQKDLKDRFGEWYIELWNDEKVFTIYKNPQFSIINHRNGEVVVSVPTKDLYEKLIDLWVR